MLPLNVSAARYGAPDTLWRITIMSAPSASIVLTVSTSDSPFDTDDEAAALSRELIAFCRSELADVKCPRTVDFRDELPRHPTGKLYKRLLKDEYWAAAGRSI